MSLLSHQLRAARALLNWSRTELARHAEVSENTLHRFENEISLPEERTVQKILAVLGHAGVELVGTKGVILRDEAIETLTGDHVFVRVLEDAIATLKDAEDPEALFACVCDQVSPQEVIAQYNRLRAQGIRMRSLIKEGDTHLLGNLNEYRCIPNQFFHNNAMVIYGNRVATMILDPLTGGDAGAVIIKNTHAAAAQRNLFELIWSNLKAPVTTTAPNRYANVNS